MPTPSLVARTQWSASATNKYRRGASGHPCRTPAWKSTQGDSTPFTEARARVLVSSTRTAKQSCSGTPANVITRKRNSRSTVSYAFMKSAKIRQPKSPLLSSSAWAA